MSNLEKPLDAETIKAVLIGGDLRKLTDAQQISYINRVCESVGVNPLTKPFQLIELNRKLVLYATRDCTDQLRKVHKVSIKITARESINGVYVVTAQALLPDGRHDESTGAVVTERLAGEALANAYLKCETKAKRRVTLSICGLGLLDETEVETIKDAVKVETPAVRLPIKTLADIELDHAKELQQALKEDQKEIVVKKSKADKTDFRVPAKFDKKPGEEPDYMKMYGEYVAETGKPGGSILGKKIKDIDPKELDKFMIYLRGGDQFIKPSQDYLRMHSTQEFIAMTEGYINEKKRKSIEADQTTGTKS